MSSQEQKIVICEDCGNKMNLRTEELGPTPAAGDGSVSGVTLIFPAIVKILSLLIRLMPVG